MSVATLTTALVIKLVRSYSDQFIERVPVGSRHLNFDIASFDGDLVRLTAHWKFPLRFSHLTLP